MKTGDARQDPARAQALIENELAGWRGRGGFDGATMRDFEAHRQVPERVEVTFSGGLVQDCWAVTRPNGPYQVIFMPKAGYFSLCVTSHFGPLDIGVHGAAIDCFGSV